MRIGKAMSGQQKRFCGLIMTVQTNSADNIVKIIYCTFKFGRAGPNKAKNPTKLKITDLTGRGKQLFIFKVKSIGFLHVANTFSHAYLHVNTHAR